MAQAQSIEILDSITSLKAEHRSKVIVTGSHGGLYSGYAAAKGAVRGVLFNDAGVGLDASGIGALPYLNAFGIPAAAIDGDTAMIGRGQDMVERGLVSYVNDVAGACGCRPGDTCLDAAAKLTGAPWVTAHPQPFGEIRFLLRDGPIPIWGIDSASLVDPRDRGAIVVTGSHGGLLGGKPETALRVDALAAVFHDAGIGIDGAGVTRLPALDARGIAAAAVAARSARVGDAQSIWATGEISTLNRTAIGRGARIGMTVPEFAEIVGRGAVAARATA